MKQLIQFCLGKAHNKNSLFFKIWSHVFQACIKLAGDSLELLIHLPHPPNAGTTGACTPRLCSAGDGTQGFACAQQTLYLMSRMLSRG